MDELQASYAQGKGGKGRGDPSSSGSPSVGYRTPYGHGAGVSGAFPAHPSGIPTQHGFSPQNSDGGHRLMGHSHHGAGSSPRTQLSSSSSVSSNPYQHDLTQVVRIVLAEGAMPPLTPVAAAAELQRNFRSSIVESAIKLLVETRLDLPLTRATLATYTDQLRTLLRRFSGPAASLLSIVAFPEQLVSSLYAMGACRAQENRIFVNPASLPLDMAVGVLEASFSHENAFRITKLQHEYHYLAEGNLSVENTEALVEVIKKASRFALELHVSNMAVEGGFLMGDVIIDRDSVGTTQALTHLFSFTLKAALIDEARKQNTTTKISGLDSLPLHALASAAAGLHAKATTQRALAPLFGLGDNPAATKSKVPANLLNQRPDPAPHRQRDAAAAAAAMLEYDPPHEDVNDAQVSEVRKRLGHLEVAMQDQQCLVTKSLYGLTRRVDGLEDAAVKGEGEANYDTVAAIASGAGPRRAPGTPYRRLSVSSSSTTGMERARPVLKEAPPGVCKLDFNGLACYTMLAYGAHGRKQEEGFPQLKHPLFASMELDAYVAMARERDNFKGTPHHTLRAAHAAAKAAVATKDPHTSAHGASTGT